VVDHQRQRGRLTRKRSANQIFSFGRDHGYYGRILSQTVVPWTPGGPGRNGWSGSASPPDGNALLSSIAATLWCLGDVMIGSRCCAAIFGGPSVPAVDDPGHAATQSVLGSAAVHAVLTTCCRAQPCGGPA
jgi:hypothetical protein